MTLATAWEKINALRIQCRKFLFGLDQTIDQMLTGMFSLIPYDGEGRKEMGQGHVFMLAPPGFGKTGLMRILASAVNASCSFVTGHPEMKAGEIIGSSIYDQSSQKIVFVKGGILTNFYLFDEANRAHPKSQAVLLQGMEERMVVANIFNPEQGKMENRTFRLHPISDDPQEQGRIFWVIATGNPIEQEGTYTIPEAQLDRFSFSFGIDFPLREEEKKIRAENVYGELSGPRIEKVMDLSEMLEISHLIYRQVHFSSQADEYIMRLIENSRPRLSRTRKFASPAFLRLVDEYVRLGLSPRSNFHFQAGARTLAFLRGRDYVALDDVKAAAYLVMPHRLILEPKARARRLSNQIMIKLILENTELPTCSLR